MSAATGTLPAPPLGVKDKKHLVVRALLAQAGNLVEFWSVLGRDDEVDAEFARECLARWLRDLPGEEWDVRLDPPGTA
ncbi:hypothetical protein ABT039_22600 [Streptomyces lasiicapitis]|uniref:hypothetical protein n=1 Tax=Streptomyces lasiicapitis TaxID=1923961 RepID=UPI003325BBB9